MNRSNIPSLVSRIETSIDNYLSKTIELSEGVKYSQYETIKRIYRFKNRALEDKINPDLSYNYYYDIISPRTDSEVKNLRFDTKHVLVFSRNPRKDFSAVFLANASLKEWMAENGEDEKLKAAVEEFSANGNIGFKKVKGGYEIVDALNTYITNERAENIDDTDIIERHEMTASQLVSMDAWDKDEVQETIKNCGNKSFSATLKTTSIDSTNKRYEIFEFTGEISEAEYYELIGSEVEGSNDKYFLAKVILGGLKKGGDGKRNVLFIDELKGKVSDHYIYAHRGRYEGRFWRVGMYELLFDHQVRANEIGNQLARGLDWASKVIFHSTDSTLLMNIRADLENGDVIIGKDMAQINVRMQGLDQLIADWNRLLSDADRLSGSFEVVRGEALPSGTPFRMGLLIDQNAGKMFVMLRQKLTLPYKRVFRQWVLPELVKHLKGKDIFRLVGEVDLMDQLREILVESWYIQNLVTIGPHTKEVAAALKADKLDQLRKVDPVIENTKEIWEGVLPRLFVTITGENSDIQDQIQDLQALIQLETDPDRIAWIMDMMYKARGIPIPPKKEEQPPDPLLPEPPEKGKKSQKTTKSEEPPTLGA